MMKRTVLWSWLVWFMLVYSVWCAEEAESDKETKRKKKDIRDYNEADLERLYEQWEEKDEPLEPDELPEWKKPPPSVDFSKLDSSNPEQLLQASKKGRTLMLFASLTGDPTQDELEKVTQLWQTSLFNAHIDAQRFLIDKNRAIFMFKDGSMAWQAKDFLIKQDRCLEVNIEGKSYPGKGSGKTEL